eukprot:gene4421-5430_t
MADDMELFLACGLDETKAKDTLKNPKLTAVMKAVLLEADLTSCSSTIGKMLYIVATKFPPNAIVHRPTVVKYIKEEKIKTDPMVLGALEHLKKLGAEALDVTAFEEASGVGQEVTAEQILAAVAGVMEKNNAQLLEQRYRVNVGLLLAEVRLQYPWGDLKLAKICERAFLKLAKARYLSIRLRSTQAELDKRIEALLGKRAELYDLALELIKRGKAYACQQTKPETKASRDALQAWNFEISKKGLDKKDVELPAECQSPYRNRSVEENLRIFKEMKMGMWPEGSVCLRMKGDLKSGNSSMWDLAAYRIIFAAHPHSKDKWCIYPTYDYTHCLVDSLENVTHSLCTLEFSTRQAPDGPYYWLLDALDMYKPITWEFARCNITYNVMSKRKLNKLVTLGFVNGWDDPRILTLEGMRRRGYTATAINRFSEDLGVTKNDNTQHLSKLEGCLRNELEETTTRAFAVLDPLAVYITNYPKEGLPVISDVPNHPQYPDRGVRALNLTKMIYIERSDFREADSKDYFGLAPGKTVRLLFGYNMTCEHVSKGASGKVLSLRCSLDLDSHKPAPGMKMPKGVLHWASEESFPAEVRVYNPLFTVPEPGRPDKAAVSASTAAGGNAGAGDNEDEEEESEVDYLTQLNPNSLELYPDARIEPLMKEFMDKPLSKSFQFQRLGYFTVDKDSTASKPVLNRIVALKESRDVKAIKQR